MFIYPSATNGMIFSLNHRSKFTPGQENHLSISVASQRLQTVLYDSAAVVSTLISTSSFTTNDWHHIAVCISNDYVERSTTINQYFDGVLQGSDIWTGGVFYHESPGYALVGAEDDIVSSNYVKASFFNGFVWDLCIYEGCKTTWTDVIQRDTCDNSQCTVCPVGTCLIDCPWGSWYNEETNSCVACDPGCTEGCVRAENCHPCFDPECASVGCPKWDDATCGQCITNASNPDDCVCDPGFFFDLASTTCVQCYSRCSSCFGS